MTRKMVHVEPLRKGTRRFITVTLSRNPAKIGAVPVASSIWATTWLSTKVTMAEDMELHDTDVVEEVEEEDVGDLPDKLEQASSATGKAQVKLLMEVIGDDRTGPKATQFKERAVYDLTRSYCRSKQFTQVVEFLTGAAGQSFLSSLTKAKTAKVVRQVLDIVCTQSIAEGATPTELQTAYNMQESVARSILHWTEQERRSFLRQRVEARLATILFHQQKYADALEICDRLLGELKKLDDKQLLVETHLLESKIHFALCNVPKAKAALTASRTAANAIYVSPALQADIDSMSGTIHTEETDYNTAYSYFLEAFEQLDQMGDEAAAVKALKYMMLCKILDALRAALKVGGPVAKQTEDLASTIVSGKQGVKYAGRDISAMTAIAKASTNRNLKEFQAVLDEYNVELQQDLMIQHHLDILQSQLLESNLIRVIEPYSCVEISHVAELMDMPIGDVERKLSQMILDGSFAGILDQGAGQLIVYEESEKDAAMEKGLQVLANMDAVVTSLFERSKALRTMMI